VRFDRIIINQQQIGGAPPRIRGLRIPAEERMKWLPTPEPELPSL
jgi:uncharacterized protein (DUF433 family)